MSKRLLLSLSLFSLTFGGCALEGDDASTPEFDELEAGLGLAGKADGLTNTITRYTNGIALRHAPARTLYNLLHDADARAVTGNGTRVLYAPGMGCITNGLATYCELRGSTEGSFGGYEVLLHGNANSSAVATLHTLVGDGSSDSFVATPWFACERAGNGTWCGIEKSENLEIIFDGLEDAGDDFVYEGWAISGGAPTTTDRFRAGGTGVNQRVPASIADDSLYVLTIEPRRGDASAPASTHLVAGALDLGGTTSLGIDHGAALGTDFADASGNYILATPTSASTDDETSGVWFVDPVAGAPSLDLPTLPPGWAYEGWVVTGDGPISTGRFTELAMSDSDGAGPTAGPGMAPPFPGQDFVNPSIDLLGRTIVISVEPEPDNSPAPFAIKPLIDSTVENVMAHNSQSLANTSENRPSAIANFGN